MKIRKYFIVLFVICLVLTGCQGNGAKEQAGDQTKSGDTTTDGGKENTEETDPVEPIEKLGEYEAYVPKEGDIEIEIDIEEYGVVSVALLPDKAPITVEHFVKLIEEKTFDGLTFHRIMVGFMMQGGQPKDPNVSLETIEGEFEKNGHDNPISHTRGAISMARTPDMNSASQQFFIVQENSTFLDGEYAGFGYVTAGIEIVDKICEEAVVIDNNGTVPEADQPIIKSIRLK